MIPGISLGSLARVLRAAADECDAIARESAHERKDWIAQNESPLGPRRHIAAVRRRLQTGMDGAGQSGRRYLLSPDALAQELGRESQHPKADVPDVRGDLEQRLRLVGGSL